MAKLARKTLKVFGKDGTVDNFGQFGSKAAGSPVNTKDVATIQSLTAWNDGWQEAITASKAPFLEDMNSAMYVQTYETAYVLQEGIAEWDSGTTYFIGSMVKKTGTFELYGSNVDNNTGNALPSQTNNANWTYLNPPTQPPGMLSDFAGSSAPSGWLLCDGSAIDRTVYAALFAVVGTTWGPGNGATTFNIPDFRGRATIGSGQGTGLTNRVLGVSLGEETHVLSTAEMPQHSHVLTDPGHHHVYNSAVAGVNAQGGSGTTFSSRDTSDSTTGITMATAGSSAAHNNMQPSAVVTKIIKF